MTAATNRRLVLVIDTDAGFAEDSRHLLADERVLVVRSIEEAAEVVVGGRVDLALLGPSFGNEAAVLSAGLLREAAPGLTAVLVANIVTNRILLAALRSGLVDVIGTPLTANKLAGLLDRVQPHRVPEGTVVLEEPLPDLVEDGGASATQASQVAPLPLAAPEMQDEPPAPIEQEPELVIEPVTLTFEATTSLSTEVSFTEDESFPEAEEPVVVSAPPDPAPPVLPPPPIVDAWTVPIDSIDFPAAPGDTHDADPVDRHAADPDFTDEHSAVGIQVTEQDDPPPPSPDIYAAPPPPPPDEIPAPPEFDPPRRQPVDLERIGVLPADGPRRRYPSGPGRVVAVMAGKGGSGKTITATNLALALILQRGDDTVAVVDADLQFGDVALMLDLDPTPTLADAVSRIDGLSDAGIDALLQRHESGLRVLAAPLGPLSPEAIPAKSIVEVIERLRGMYEVVLVDTPSVFDDGLMTLLEDADEVLLVVDMDVPAVKNAKIALDTLRASRFPMDRVRLVVNRANAKARLDLVEVERSLGLRVAGSIPSDRLIPQGVNDGVPVVALSPRSRVARSFHALAGILALPEPRRSA